MDEADSILIDEARTPLIIGANNQPTQEEASAYYGADELAATLVRVKDFKYDPAERKAELNAAGRRKVQARRPATPRSQRSPSISSTSTSSVLCVPRSPTCATANTWSSPATRGSEVVIVDEFTGRMMPGRQWQDGLHQAIQAKERLEITLETITAARVTVQDFFKRYKKLSGMTGTAWGDANEMRRDLQGPRLPGADEPSRPTNLVRGPRLLHRGREVPAPSPRTSFGSTRSRFRYWWAPARSRSRRSSAPC